VVVKPVIKTDKGTPLPPPPPSLTAVDDLQVLKAVMKTYSAAQYVFALGVQVSIPPPPCPLVRVGVTLCVLADATSHQSAIADSKSFEPARGGCQPTNALPSDISSRRGVCRRLRVS
jgi:hypothetical protein